MNVNQPASDAPDDRGAAVIAADDTGMVRSEQIVVETELDGLLDAPDR